MGFQAKSKQNNNHMIYDEQIRRQKSNLVIPERTFSLKNNLKSTLSEEDLLNIVHSNNSRINHQNINNMTGLTTLNQKIAQMTQEFTDKIVQLQTIQPNNKIVP